MPVGLSVAIVLFAQAASSAPTPAGAKSAYGPVAAAPSSPPPSPSDQTQRECTSQASGPKGNEIVVCAIKPDGYRLPPDIVEARRLKKEGVTIRPHNPHETFADHSCAHVGPMGCLGAPTLDLLAVAATAAEISKRMAKGQEIGSIFQTEKSSTDYQYYQIAKKEREEKEAAAAGKAAKAKAMAAAKAQGKPTISAATTSAPPPSPPSANRPSSANPPAAPAATALSASARPSNGHLNFAKEKGPALLPALLNSLSQAQP